MSNKKETLKREVIVNGRLYGFEEVISSIIDNVYDPPHLVIACNFIDNTSSITHIPDGSIIRIGFKNRTGEPIEVIWTLLHEYGHYLSGIPSNPGIDSETKAWDNAFKEIDKYPLLLKHLDSFYEYKEKCLLTYQNNKSNS